MPTSETHARGGPCQARPLAEVVLRAAQTGLGGRLRRDDVDDLAAALGAELDRAGDEREQRVVAATADALAGVEVRAALADDDLAGVDDLAAEALDAEALGVGVATVAGRGRALLVCHVSACLLLSLLGSRGRSGVDGGDLDLGQVLTVTLTLLVAGLVLELHDA